MRTGGLSRGRLGSESALTGNTAMLLCVSFSMIWRLVEPRPRVVFERRTLRFRRGRASIASVVTVISSWRSGILC